MRLLDSVNGHLLKLLSARASETLYFSIAPPLKAALVHFVIRFFIYLFKGELIGWFGGRWGQDQQG